jgi:hypothetical protein
MGKTTWLYAIAALLLLVGCSTNEPPHATIDSIPPPAISLTPIPSMTPAPTETVTAAQSPTSTSTQTATLTPSPTGTPFGNFKGEWVIVQKFKGQDLFLFSLDGKEIDNLTKDMSGDKLFMGWSPDGKTILVGEYDSDRLSSITKLQVWLVDITGGKKQALVESNGLTGYDWSPDGKRIMVECYNGRICLVDPTTFEVIQTRYSGNTVGFSPDSRLLSWDNFPPKTSLQGRLPVKPVVQHGTLYTWAEGDPNLTQVLSYSSYLGNAGTHWARDGQSLYILDLVDGKSALSQVLLASRVVKHLYQFERDICATGLSPDGRIFLVREKVVEGNSASCTGPLGLADLEQGELVWYDDLRDVKWIKWTADNRALVVLLNDGVELMIDLDSGATSPTDWLNWTKFFEFWALQEMR